MSLRRFATLHYEAAVGQLFENELVDCFAGTGDRQSTIDFDPREADAYRWVVMSSLRHEIDTAPNHYAPWFGIYVQKGTADVSTLGEAVMDEVQVQGHGFRQRDILALYLAHRQRRHLQCL